jgi:probable phosphoglycerate mutase
MKTIIVVARHGNTFAKGETPRRIGAKTNLPLVETLRGTSVGLYLKAHALVPSAIYAAPLSRTLQTAELAAAACGAEVAITELNEFTEIDYGPDENKTEEEVFLRLGAGDPNRGRATVEAWNVSATVPDGWRVDVRRIVDAWLEFAAAVETGLKGKIALIVTSNGIIRFAPHLTGDFDGFANGHELKVATGAVCIFEKDEDARFWTCREWNVKPYRMQF